MYGKVRKDVVEILKHLCQIEGIELIEGGSMRRPCAYVRIHTTEGEHIQRDVSIEGKERTHAV